MSLAFAGKGKKGIHRYVVFYLLVLVLAAAAAGEVLWPLALLPNGCGPSSRQEERAIAEIEDVIEDFYDDLIEGKRDELADYCAGDARDAFEDAIEAGIPYPFGRYSDAKFEEVGRIRLDGDEATARAEIELDGNTEKEDFELEYDDGEWLISDWEGLELLEGGGSAGVVTAIEESDVLRAVEAFMSAYSRIDLDGMLAVMTDELAEENRDLFDVLSNSDPEELEQRKPVEWNRIEMFAEDGNYRVNMMIRLKANPDREERLGLELIKVGMEWKVDEIRTYWFEREEAGEAIEVPVQ